MPETFPIKRESLTKPLTGRFDSSTEKSLYSRFSPRSESKNSLIKIGAQEPFYWTNLTDSHFLKYLDKYDSQSLPIGTTVKDTCRISKFLVSGRGVGFLAKQFLLQKENAFNETRIYNPISIIGSVTRYGTLGLQDRPKRHVEVSSTLMGSLKNAALGGLGLSDGGNKEKPPGIATAEVDDLVTKYNQSGKGNVLTGIIRNQTAATARSNFLEKWAVASPTSTGKKSLLSQLGSAIVAKVTSLIPSTKTKEADWKYRVEYSKTSNVFEQMYSSDNLTFTSKDKKVFSVKNIHKYKPSKDDVDNKESWYYPERKQIKGIDNENSILLKLHKKLEQGGYDPLYDYSFDIKQLRSPSRSDRDIDTYLVHNYKYLFKSTQEKYHQEIKKNSSHQTLDTSFGTRGGDEYNRLGVLSGDLYSIPKELLSSKSGTQSKDLIFFYFYDVVNKKYIPFRAMLNGINESNSADWEEVPYLGRPDKSYVYKGFNRELNFGFKIHTNSIKEQIPIWDRLNHLVGMTRPSKYITAGTRADKFMVPPMTMIRIGDMYNNQPCLLRSVSVTIPDESLWELISNSKYTHLYKIVKDAKAKKGTADISSGIKKSQGVNTEAFDSFSRAIYNSSASENVISKQLPYMIDVNISCILLDKELPETNKFRFGDSVVEGTIAAAATIASAFNVANETKATLQSISPATIFTDTNLTSSVDVTSPMQVTATTTTFDNSNLTSAVDSRKFATADTTSTSFKL